MAIRPNVLDCETGVLYRYLRYTFQKKLFLDRSILNLSKKSLIKGMSVLILPVYDGRPVFFYLILSDEKNVSSGTKKIMVVKCMKGFSKCKTYCQISRNILGTNHQNSVKFA